METNSGVHLASCSAFRECPGVRRKRKAFETTARTITLKSPRRARPGGALLKPGQIIRIINQTNRRREAEFRVIGPITPPLDKLGEWGVECLRVDKNIWDIHFPPPSEDSDAHVLLRAAFAISLSLQSLSLVEVEVLETAGLLTKPCVHCGESTAWGYPKRSFELETITYQAAVSEATGGLPTLAAERRKSFRRAAQFPIRVPGLLWRNGDCPNGERLSGGFLLFQFAYVPRGPGNRGDLSIRSGQ